MNPLRIFFILSIVCAPSYAFWSWTELWNTPNQHAAKLMKKAQFADAQNLFTDPAWQATAAYRAHDYQTAQALFGQLNSADGFYNQGNAQAYAGAYDKAIQAYDESLKLRPNDPDTLYNRKIVQSLIKQQDQQKQDQL